MESNNKLSVAVIGGGAAGLMAAISAARMGVSVTLFEKNDRCGKKLARARVAVIFILVSSLL